MSKSKMIRVDDRFDEVIKRKKEQIFKQKGVSIPEVRLTRKAGDLLEMIPAEFFVIKVNKKGNKGRERIL